jgi:hypothetical protein
LTSCLAVYTKTGLPYSHVPQIQSQHSYSANCHPSAGCWFFHQFAYAAGVGLSGIKLPAAFTTAQLVSVLEQLPTVAGTPDLDIIALRWHRSSHQCAEADCHQ